MFSSTRSALLILLALTMSLGTPIDAGAKVSESSQAASAYESGKGKLRAGKFARALEIFREGLNAAETDQLETWQLLLGAALASEKLKEGASAIEYYRRFLDASEGAEKLLPPKWRERRQVVSDAVDELQRKLNTTHGYLTVSSTPAKAAIYVNEARAGVDKNAVTPFGLFLDPGTYTIRVERSGYETMVKEIKIEAGKLKPLALTLSEIVVTPPPPPPAPAAPQALERVESEASGVVAKMELQDEGSGLATPGWVLIGTGGAVVIGGVVTTVLGALLHRDMNAIAPGEVSSAEWDAKKADLELYSTLGGVMYGVGGAAAAAGLVLLMLDKASPSEEPSALSFDLSPLPGGAFAQGSLRF